MAEKEKKDQFIIAYLADTRQPEAVLSYAVYMSQKLGKGLVLLHICDPKYSTLTTAEAETRLQELVAQTAAQHSDIHCSYAALKGKTIDIINALPTLMNAVLIVAQVDRHARRRSALHKKSVLKNFAQCRTAYLTVQEPLSAASQMQDVSTAIDFKKESKDKLIWSSYFPRFCGSTMHILYYDYKDQFLHSKWYANMTQLHKLYSGLNLTFTPHIIPAKSTFLDINALRYADQSRYGMLIAVTTKEKDGLEFFIGVQEERTIVNKAHIPILFLNPREELYVLCD